MLEKVLVCLDGSREAEQIVTGLTPDTVKAGSHVVLLRVIALPEIHVPIAIPGAPGLPINTQASLKQMSEKETEATRYLEQIAAHLRQQGLTADYEVMPGTPGEAIVQYARENGFTMIAIGTHGHGVTRRFFLGSTADYVLRQADIPVLTIRPR